MGRGGDLGPGDAAVGDAADVEHRTLTHDVVGAGLEEVGGDASRLLRDPPGVDDGRHPAARDAAAPVGALALPDDLRVAVDDGDGLHGESELVGGELGEARLVALPVRRAAGLDGDVAVRPDDDVARLVVDERAHLHVRREPDPVEPPGRARPGLLGAERGVARALEEGVERLPVVPAVVARAPRGLVRELVRRDEVRPPDLGRVEADLSGEAMDHPLDEVGALGAARPAVRRRPHRVREGAPHLDARGGDVVAARDHLAAEDRQDRPVAEEAEAEVADDPRLQAEDPPRPVGGEADVRHDVAAVGGGLEVLAPGRRPADRTAEPPGEPRDDQVLRVERDLRAEPAADPGRDHAHPLGRQLEVLRHVVAKPVRGLGRAPDREPVTAGVIHGRDPPRLHRHGQEPLVHQPGLDDDRRRGEDPIHVPSASRPADPEVRREVRIDARRVRREGGLGIGHRRQGRVLDTHEVGGVLRGVRGLRDDHRDGLADIAGAALGKRPSTLDLGLVEGLRPDHHGDLAHRRVEVGPGEDPVDARCPAGRRGVDPPDLGVRMRAPDDGHVERPGQGQVGDVRLAGGQEREVLSSLDRLSHVCRCHGAAPPVARRLGAGARRDAASTAKAGAPSSAAPG